MVAWLAAGVLIWHAVPEKEGAARKRPPYCCDVSAR